MSLFWIFAIVLPAWKVDSQEAFNWMCLHPVATGLFLFCYECVSSIVWRAVWPKKGHGWRK